MPSRLALASRLARPTSELLDLYRQAWVVASASAHEGWGMTLTEAAACGTPAVATRIAGHDDAVLHERTGLLVDDGPDVRAARSTGPRRRRRCGRDSARRARARADGSRGARRRAARSRCSRPKRSADARRERAGDRRQSADGRAASSPTWRRAALGYLGLALLAYVPVLRTCPGKVAADTKQYLYLDPGRLLDRAVTMWDPNIGMGTVTHQNIGYLFPMGPYYWVLDRLGVPDWVAQRLWLGSFLFAAGAGVLYLLRTFGLRGPGVVVAALAYMLTPYMLDYAARISVLLMPWAALPWMIGLMRKALRDGGWRYPALFALVVQVVGGVNATALLFAGLGPVLWIVVRRGSSTARCSGAARSA